MNNPFNNPFNYSDYFKGFGDFKAPNFTQGVDFNNWFSAQRRNTEAASAAGQVVVEGYQAVMRRVAEIARGQVEQVIRTSKEQFTTASPEQNVARVVDFSRSFFESNLQNARELSEMVTKFGYEAFDLLNKRASENFEEIGKTASSSGRKKAA